MSEKFCLKWNDFETNVSKSFGLLRNEEYLHDVTLVCDDNNQVSAHKLVLSACSEFFKTVFKNNKHQNPLICLEGISSKELQDILDYMYNGETKIFQEGLDKFLAIAQRFRIMGLLQNEESNVDLGEPQYQTNQEDKFSDGVADDIQSKSDILTEGFKIEERSNYVSDFDNQMKRTANRNSNRAISLNVDDVNDVNQQVDELIETLPDGSLKCTHCGKLASRDNVKQVCRRNMRNHVETHLDGLSFDCQLCGKTFRSRPSLNNHVSRNHRSKLVK